MTPSNQFQEQNEVLAILGTRHTLTMRMSLEKVSIVAVVQHKPMYIYTANNDEKETVSYA